MRRRDAGKRVEQRQCQCNQSQCQYQCGQVDQQGLQEKLPHQLAAGGAGHLAQTDLPGPGEGAGGGKINVIDPGHDDDESSNDQQKIDRVKLAVQLVFLHEMGAEVDVA